MGIVVGMKQHASPSQITTADRCMRKWYFESCLGMRSPDSPGALLGSHVHHLVERRLGNRLWDVAAPATKEWRELQAKAAYIKASHIKFDLALTVARRLLVAATERFAIDVLERGRIEVPFVLSRPTLKLPLHGRADLVLPDFVLDWKTTSDLGYLKKPEEFRTDNQVLIYGEAFDLPFVHVYAETRALRTHVQITQLSREERAKNFLRIEDTVARMVDVRTEAGGQWRKVEGNLAACSDFGGCPFRGRCSNRQKEVTMDFAARRAELAAKGIPTIYTTAVVPQAAAPAVEEQPRVNPPEAARIPAPLPEPPPLAASTPVAPIAEQPADVKASKKAAKTAASKPASETVPLDSAQGSGLTSPTRALYIGCLPVGELVTNGSEWLAPFAASAAKLLDVTYWTEPDFGKGAAAVHAMVYAAATAGELPAALYLDRRDRLAESVIELLVPFYRDGGKGLVVQKVG